VIIGAQFIIVEHNIDVVLNFEMGHHIINSVLIAMHHPFRRRRWPSVNFWSIIMGVPTTIIDDPPDP
jgi:hypothetical protein